MRKYKSRAIKHVAPSAYAKCLRNFTYAKWLRHASAQAKWPTQLLKSSLLYKFHHFKKNRSSFKFVCLAEHKTRNNSPSSWARFSKHHTNQSRCQSGSAQDPGDGGHGRLAIDSNDMALNPFSLSQNLSRLQATWLATSFFSERWL